MAQPDQPDQDQGERRTKEGYRIVNFGGMGDFIDPHSLPAPAAPDTGPFGLSLDQLAQQYPRIARMLQDVIYPNTALAQNAQGQTLKPSELVSGTVREATTPETIALLSTPVTGPLGPYAAPAARAGVAGITSVLRDYMSGERDLQTIGARALLHGAVQPVSDLAGWTIGKGLNAANAISPATMQAIDAAAAAYPKLRPISSALGVLMGREAPAVASTAAPVAEQVLSQAEAQTASQAAQAARTAATQNAAREARAAQQAISSNPTIQQAAGRTLPGMPQGMDIVSPQGEQWLKDEITRRATAGQSLSDPEYAALNDTWRAVHDHLAANPMAGQQATSIAQQQLDAAAQLARQKAGSLQQLLRDQISAAEDLASQRARELTTAAGNQLSNIRLGLRGLLSGGSQLLDRYLNQPNQPARPY